MVISIVVSSVIGADADMNMAWTGTEIAAGIQVRVFYSVSS